MSEGNPSQPLFHLHRHPLQLLVTLKIQTENCPPLEEELTPQLVQGQEPLVPEEEQAVVQEQAPLAALVQAVLEELALQQALAGAVATLAEASASVGAGRALPAHIQEQSPYRVNVPGALAGPPDHAWPKAGIRWTKTKHQLLEALLATVGPADALLHQFGTYERGFECS